MEASNQSKLSLSSIFINHRLVFQNLETIFVSESDGDSAIQDACEDF